MAADCVIIVGAGEAGCRAAFALREHGFKGNILLLGEEPLAPYERPPLSKRLQEAEAPPFIARMEDFSAQAITFRPACRVAAIQPENHAIRLTSGEELPYTQLLLATGARPRRLKIDGADSVDIFYLRTHEDALRLSRILVPGRRIAVVGGGFIGLELAALARAASADVILFEAAPRLLTRSAPADLADRLAALHSQAGVELRLDARIKCIELTGTAKPFLILDDNECIACDAIVVGVGAEPEIALAAAAGLAIDNGIAVDNELRTSAPDIFAVGDCCSFPLALYGGRRIRLEAWRNAQDQGNLAARNILGACEHYTAVPWLWSDQYDVTLQIAGLIDEGTTIATRLFAGGEAVLHFHLDGTGRLVAASGLGPNGMIARDIRLAEMLIARRAHPDTTLLTQPDVTLKSLLAA